MRAPDAGIAEQNKENIMSHLTCISHQRRIIINPKTADVAHRSDGSFCESPLVRIGGTDIGITVGEFCVMALETV
jgi:hypothetical protein